MVDGGADRTVISAALLKNLRFSPGHSRPDFGLSGIGGTSPFILIATSLEFMRDDGGIARVTGEFAAFTDPNATDLNILGRDILNNFDLIISRRRDDVLLLAPNHTYTVK